MASLILKSARVQPILLHSVQPPSQPVFYSEETTIEVLDEIEVVICPDGEIEVAVCQED